LKEDENNWVFHFFCSMMSLGDLTCRYFTATGNTIQFSNQEISKLLSHRLELSSSQYFIHLFLLCNKQS
jgi:hypothetical protein